MLEQLVCTIESTNTVNGLVLRFGPLGNKSHHKAINNEIEKLVDNGERYKLYESWFPTLEAMNQKGWKLESFAFFYDVNQLKIQVAIFSKEL